MASSKVKRSRVRTTSRQSINRATLRSQLKRHEGERLYPYTDTVGKLTIGVGHNLTDNGIPQFVSDLLLDDDIDRAIKGLQSLLSFESLDEVRQRVLINMAFNMGVSKLRGFKLMLAAVKAGNYSEAAYQMLNSQWATQVGQRAVELANMMKTGRSD